MKIIVYSTSTCPYCRQLKSYLDGKNVQYEDVVLDRQPEKVRQMQQLSGGFSGVPFTVVESDDGKVETIKGFDKNRIDEILEIIKS